jgi:hypothetical protein
MTYVAYVHIAFQPLVVNNYFWGGFKSTRPDLVNFIQVRGDDGRMGWVDGLRWGEAWMRAAVCGEAAAAAAAAAAADGAAVPLTPTPAHRPPQPCT